MAVAGTVLAAGAASAAHAVGPGEIQFVPLGAGYSVALQEQVDYWNLNRLAAAGLNENSDGTDAVAPAAGWDDTARPWGGSDTVRRTTGKLVMRMRNADGVNWETLAPCTATVVRSQNKSVVVTAAHCLRVNWGSNIDPGLNVIATSVLFIPGFRGENLPRLAPGASAETGPAIGADVAPYGVWPVTRAWLTEGWTGKANHVNDHDMAAMVVDNPADSRPIEDVVGGQPIAFNQPRAAPRVNFGFPTVNFKSYSGPNTAADGTRVINGAPNVNNVPAVNQRIYDGRTLMYSQGASWIGYEWWWQTNNNIMKTQFSPGASGGPWFKDLDPVTGEGFLVGVTSHFAQSSAGGLDAIADIELRAPSPYMAGTNFTNQENAAYQAAATVSVP
ncbi:hypothetical protein [Actinocorallia sp. A-T 12471]|uniref:trypsin-like serine peptidase n=1 Tax=Actinocorallia sp. A-T 12471 TaxID=3089813 RepID=UPI0029CF53A8|nr:hypothetical protein [Actinocorallia sp. A-T 12471]MDX6739042.1 hypothetical protein [Actinocorallia sp. A-T 12471]